MVTPASVRLGVRRLPGRLTAPDPGNHRSLSDSALRLTKDEAAELMEELGAVLQQWRERTQGTDDERSTYSIYQMIQPYPERPEVD